MRRSRSFLYKVKGQPGKPVGSSSMEENKQTKIKGLYMNKIFLWLFKKYIPKIHVFMGRDSIFYIGENSIYFPPHGESLKDSVIKLLKKGS